ncbi:hypothetical protein CBL_13644 [Carabus blaptoides fortunei]
MVRQVDELYIDMKQVDQKSITECLGESVLVVRISHAHTATVEDGCCVVPSTRAWLAFVIRTEWSTRVALTAAVVEAEATMCEVFCGFNGDEPLPLVHHRNRSLQSNELIWQLITAKEKLKQLQLKTKYVPFICAFADNGNVRVVGCAVDGGGEVRGRKAASHELTNWQSLLKDPQTNCRWAERVRLGCSNSDSRTSIRSSNFLHRHPQLNKARVCLDNTGGRDNHKNADNGRMKADCPDKVFSVGTSGVGAGFGGGHVTFTSSSSRTRTLLSLARPSFSDKSTNYLIDKAGLLVQKRAGADVSVNMTLAHRRMDKSQLDAECRSSDGSRLHSSCRNGSVLTVVYCIVYISLIALALGFRIRATYPLAGSRLLAVGPEFLLSSFVQTRTAAGCASRRNAVLGYYIVALLLIRSKEVEKQLGDRARTADRTCTSTVCIGELYRAPCEQASDRARVVVVEVKEAVKGDSVPRTGTVLYCIVLERDHATRRERELTTPTNSRQCEECRPGAPIRATRVTSGVRAVPYPQRLYPVSGNTVRAIPVHQQQQLQPQQLHPTLVAGVPSQQPQQLTIQQQHRQSIDTSNISCRCRASASNVCAASTSATVHPTVVQEVTGVVQQQCGTVRDSSVGVPVPAPVHTVSAQVSAPPAVVAAVPVAVAAPSATPMLFVPFSVPSFAPPMTGAALQNANNCSPSGGSTVKGIVNIGQDCTNKCAMGTFFQNAIVSILEKQSWNGALSVLCTSIAL